MYKNKNRGGGQDALTSIIKGPSSEGLATRSSMPGMNYHIAHGWGARPIPVDSVLFLWDILSMMSSEKTVIGKSIVLFLLKYSNLEDSTIRGGVVLDIVGQMQSKPKHTIKITTI